jgi:hypothetical protein
LRARPSAATPPRAWSTLARMAACRRAARARRPAQGFRAKPSALRQLIACWAGCQVDQGRRLIPSMRCSRLGVYVLAACRSSARQSALHGELCAGARGRRSGGRTATRRCRAGPTATWSCRAAARASWCRRATAAAACSSPTLSSSATRSRRSALRGARPRGVTPRHGDACAAAAHAYADVAGGSSNCQWSRFGGGAAGLGLCGRGAVGWAGRPAARSRRGKPRGAACGGRSAAARSRCVFCPEPEPRARRAARAGRSRRRGAATRCWWSAQA